MEQKSRGLDWSAEEGIRRSLEHRRDGSKTGSRRIGISGEDSGLGGYGYWVKDRDSQVIRL